MDIAGGFSALDAAVCIEHIKDEFLRAALGGGLVGSECTVCGRTAEKSPGSGFAVSLDLVAKQVQEALQRHYVRAVDESPWDSEAGRYAIPTVDTRDAIDDVCESAFDDEYAEHIVDLVARSLDDEEWFGSAGAVEAADHYWTSFVLTVLHESRFMMLPDTPDEPETGDSLFGLSRYNPSWSISGLLTSLASLISEQDLVTTEDAGTCFYRGRLVESPHDGQGDAKYLGPAPHDKAAANRMSPPGIAMLYASGDAQTAVMEIAGHGPKPYARIGAFRSTRPLRVVDFTRRRGRPFSYFDAAGFGDWEASQVLDYYVKEITRPVIPDGREHREYVPTQIVTEYIRWGLTERVDGIKLPSAQSGEPTFVLFFDDRSVADTGSAQAGRPTPVFTLAPEDVSLFKVTRTYAGEPVMDGRGRPRVPTTTT
ncbi:RES family NAD+ phosphorylase [Cellulosimicrobium sp. Marseille-Q8652]